MSKSNWHIDGYVLNGELEYGFYSTIQKARLAAIALAKQNNGVHIEKVRLAPKKIDYSWVLESFTVTNKQKEYLMGEVWISPRNEILWNPFGNVDSFAGMYYIAPTGSLGPKFARR